MKKSFLILIILFYCLTGQTLDYFPNSFYGSFSSTGAGAAVVNGVNAIQLNPAGIGKTDATEYLVHSSSNYYSYKLLNYLHNRKTGRTFYSDKIKIAIPSLFIKTNLNNRIGLGIGFTEYVAPYLSNSKRAVTWSPLYNQVTNGNIVSAIAGISYRFNKNLSVGTNLGRTFGKVVSKIEGENHYTDLGKTLKMETRITGRNINFGSQLNYNDIDIGLVILAPVNFETEVKTTISKDSLYLNLIPENKNPSFSLPFNFIMGLAYKYSNNWRILLDVKSYFVNHSELSFNIYDYGDDYKWKSGIGFNVGTVYLSNRNDNILKFGYSYRPQVKDISNISNNAKDLLGIIGTGQNVKHIFTIGSAKQFYKVTVDYGINYSFLSWKRDYTNNNYVVEDDYKEKEIGIFFNIVYSSK